MYDVGNDGVRSLMYDAANDGARSLMYDAGNDGVKYIDDVYSVNTILSHYKYRFSYVQ